MSLLPLPAMKFSELPDYRAAVFASAQGQLADARDAYHRLLDEAEGSDDEIAISFLLQSLGNVEARDENFQLAHRHHLSAIGQSRGIPLHLIQYAKALGSYFELPDRALEKLNEAEKMLANGKWNRAKDSISQEDYQTLICDFRDELLES